MERLAKEEAEELRRYEADLAKATQASLGTADAGTDAMDPGARAGPRYTGTGCRRYRRQQMAAATPPSG